jgi:hypothetical protein
MRNIGRSGMIAGLFALILAVVGAAVLVSYAVADPDRKPKPKEEGRGLANSTLGF